jgi:hypothetical protein
MAARDHYDVHTALLQYAPGFVMTRDLEAALLAQYAANGYTPLTQGQVLAITGTPPAFPTGLKRLSDSNPCPRDGWATDRANIV